MSRTRDALANIPRGGYLLPADPAHPAQAILIATGFEVSRAMQGRTLCAQRGMRVSVVSMPATTVFDREPPEYRAAVLPPGIPRIAIEPGSSDFWRKYVGLEGAVVGIDRFGESAPGPSLMEYFRSSPERVADVIASLIQR